MSSPESRATDDGPYPKLHRSYASGPFGQVHYVFAGPQHDCDHTPIVLLHQTPRSWDEYRELIPLLAARRFVVAMDTPGFGASDPPPIHSIDNYSTAVLALADQLALPEMVLYGHHTGAAVALQVGCEAAKRVAAFVLSSVPRPHQNSQPADPSHPRIDYAETAEDGSHLRELWRQRQPMYPAGRADLLNRVVRDQLTAGEASWLGHRAVAQWNADAALNSVRCPTLLIGADADPYAYGHFREVLRGLPHSRSAVVEGGMVGLLEPRAREIATLVNGFLDDLAL